MRHSILTGCFIYKVRHEKVGEGKNDIIRIFYCPKHKVEVCRCGFEWGKHKYEGSVDYPERFLKTILDTE